MPPWRLTHRKTKQLEFAPYCPKYCCPASSPLPVKIHGPFRGAPLPVSQPASHGRRAYECHLRSIGNCLALSIERRTGKRQIDTRAEIHRECRHMRKIASILLEILNILAEILKQNVRSRE